MLQAAVEGGSVDIVARLITLGANPSIHHRLRQRGRCCMMYSDAHPHLELEPLYTAVKNDNFPILQLLLLGTPRMPYSVLRTLKDIMFRTKYTAEARLQPRLIEQYAEFFGKVLEMPRGLQEECRGVIRETLGSRPRDKVCKLPLPSKLQEYLLLKDVLVEE